MLPLLLFPFGATTVGAATRVVDSGMRNFAPIFMRVGSTSGFALAIAPALDSVPKYLVEMLLKLSPLAITWVRSVVGAVVTGIEPVPGLEPVPMERVPTGAGPPVTLPPASAEPPVLPPVLPTVLPAVLPARAVVPVGVVGAKPLLPPVALPPKVPPLRVVVPGRVPVVPLFESAPAGSAPLLPFNPGVAKSPLPVPAEPSVPGAKPG